jgi:VanZ family protein
MKKTNNKIKKILRFWLPVVLWLLVIFAFSSKPTGTATEIYWQDFIVKKFAHVVVFFVLTTLLYRALKQDVSKREAAQFAILLAVLYGVLDEIHQGFTPGREPHFRDVIFDTIGSVLAIYSLWKLLPKAPKILRSWAKSYQLT